MSKKSFMPIPPMAELPEAEEIDIPALVESYDKGDIDLICVLGPTASGKTRYAVHLAHKIEEISRLPSVARNDNEGTVARNDTVISTEGAEIKNNTVISTEGAKLRNGEIYKAEIISADSRQVYKGMDIGTGKDIDEYADVPYHLIDIAEPGSKYNIFEYQRDFEKACKEIRERGKIPILCGGSGLYIEAATCGYSLPEVPANPQRRAELEKEDTETLIGMLAALKPLHNSTDYDTRKRLIRAIEIAGYQALHPIKETGCLPKSTYYIGTLVTREERNARIDRRLDARLEEGMVDEIRGLIDSGVKPEDLIYYGLEYKFVTQYVIGELTYSQMREQLATAIHQFAKRQMTWFRGMERKGIKIHWTNNNQ
ncbi:MAG: tRNA (adenosine(37)-N6)-dimethylallyltransferase MiaA [Candidatus Cryptobacteroides sp.]